MSTDIPSTAAVVLALAQFKGPAAVDEIVALSATYLLTLERLESAGGLRPCEEWEVTTSRPERLVTAQDYESAPPHTVVEFDRRPGALGYLNWDYRWEISDDNRPHDYAAGSVAETEGPATVVRWGR